MRLKIIIALFIFISSVYVYADNEEEFKGICLVIAKDFTEVMSFKNAAVPAELEKRAEDNFILQTQRLKRFVQSNPESIWADDAQYILATLKVRYPNEEASELEYLLEKYPNMNIEEWTKTNLPWLIPKDIPIAVRIQLLMYYKESGKEDKLKALCDESIKQFPEKEQLFRKIINFKK